MRILNALGTAALAVTACYSPNAEKSCDFTCTADNMTCPNGMSCLNNFCQTAGGSDQCSGVGIDAGSGGTDASTSIDAPKSKCPSLPNTATCTLFSSAALPCFAMCSDQQTWPDALTACGNGGGKWELAVLDSGLKLGAAQSPADPTWIGLKAPTGTGATGTEWTWVSGTQLVATDSPLWGSNALHDGHQITSCGGYLGDKYYSDTCTTTHPYACVAAAVPTN